MFMMVTITTSGANFGGAKAIASHNRPLSSVLSSR